MVDRNSFDNQNTCFLIFPHHTIFNNAKTEKLTEGNELFFDSTYPLPYITSSVSFCKLNQPDPATYLFEEMKEFERARKVLKTKCAKDVDEIKKCK